MALEEPGIRLINARLRVRSAVLAIITGEYNACIDMPWIGSPAERKAYAEQAAAARELVAAEEMTPTPGKFRVTIRIDRPDGQFVTSFREVPADLLSPGGGADEGAAQDWAVRDIGAAFVDAYRRAAELPE